jgi:hypothetical protein
VSYLRDFNLVRLQWEARVRSPGVASKTGGIAPGWRPACSRTPAIRRSSVHGTACVSAHFVGQADAKARRAGRHLLESSFWEGVRDAISYNASRKESDPT